MRGIDKSVEWDADLYGELLRIGGGKERMTGYFDQNNNWPDFVKEEDRVEFIKGLHALKTSMFKGLVESGAVPLRLVCRDSLMTRSLTTLRWLYAALQMLMP